MADQSFADWLLDWIKGPRSTRTARLLAKNQEMHAQTEKILADAELEARGFRKATCEVDGQSFETSDATRTRCNDHLGSGDLVRRVVPCNFPGCEETFETFSDGRSADRTRCNDHAGRRPR